ncbi:MAG: J domain-containing protein [Nannocystaceae bacterium]|nr:J domain-containing protein [Nannocystaceae bacterium]
MTEYADAFWTRVMELAQTLDTMSYYQLLDVDATAAREVIEQAYYRRARNIHPDRHTYETDPVRKHALVRLYARFGEAFRVLRDPALRPAYQAELAAGRTRLSKDAEQASRLQRTAPDPRTPHAAKLLETARTLLAAGNIAGGRAQLQLAAQFEPDSSAIKRAIEACNKADQRATE